MTGPRSSRTQRKVVEYNESDDDDDDDDDGEGEVEEDDEMDDFDQIGAEAEGGTDDEDAYMRDAPPTQTTVKIKAPKQPPPAKSASRTSTRPAPKTPSKPILKVTKPVEEKEMELDPEDDELS